MTDTEPCIWCGHPTKGTIEHILPDAIGCPPGFVLTSGVCGNCNNGLAHVDQALVHQFEIIAFTGGVRRKGGRPPAIHSWAPLAAMRGPIGPEMYLNAGPETIEVMGKRLPAANPSHGIRNVAFKRDGDVGTVTFDQEFGQDPKFIRAIYKVAFGSVAYFSGRDTVRSSIFDPARDFVRTGKGTFRVLMMEAHDAQQRHMFGPHFTRPDSPYPMVGMTIFGVSFVVDFDPAQKGMAHIIETAPKEERFITLPIIFPSQSRRR